MIFESGAGYCNKAHLHVDGKTYYQESDDSSVTDHPIKGDIQYTVAEFKELEKAGKLKDPEVRILALGGMKLPVRYKVMNKEEKAELHKRWKAELKHFDELSTRDIVDRGIRGEIAKLYNVRMGMHKGRVARHYYPTYDLQGNLKGAFCRNLPKDFTSGSLGKTFGSTQLFGMKTRKAVAKTGTRKHTLTLVGGHLDALAAQQMLVDSAKGEWEGKLQHVWSVNKGEYSLDEIKDNLDEIKKFKKVILAFDDDKVGREFAHKVRRLIRGALILRYPEGCKDACDCIANDCEEEFVDNWFNAEEGAESSVLSPADILERGLKTPEKGLEYPWREYNDWTFGSKTNFLTVICAGSGVGKTEFTKELVDCFTERHNLTTGLIYTEEPVDYTMWVMAGKHINKKLHLPSTESTPDQPYEKVRDYTQEEAQKAVQYIADKDLLRIADTKGETHINNILQLMDTLVADGCTRIILDNLTSIRSDSQNEVKSIDEIMRALGTYVQENPVDLYVISHLTRPDSKRKPHENGGIVLMSDLRGSGSISFWANFIVGLERDTYAAGEDKFTTTVRCVKDRLTGAHTGKTFHLYGNPSTGRLISTNMAYSTDAEKATGLDNEGRKPKKKRSKKSKSKKVNKDDY